MQRGKKISGARTPPLLMAFTIYGDEGHSNYVDDGRANRDDGGRANGGGENVGGPDATAHVRAGHDSRTLAARSTRVPRTRGAERVGSSDGAR